MKFMSLLSAPIFAIALIVTPRAEAASPSALLEQRLKTSYNTMVQEVRSEESPSAKRVILEKFLARHDRSLGLLEKMLPASNESRASATTLRASIQGHRAELAGMDMRGPGASSNLNAFAGYLQQTVEQADGIYLSIGAIVIILLILILIT